eukprot:38542-Pyramimonas_sp.AAC.1
MPGCQPYLGGSGKRPGVKEKIEKQQEVPVPILWAPGTAKFLHMKADERIVELQRLKEIIHKELQQERIAFQRARNELSRQIEDGAKMKDALHKASERAQLGDVDPTDDVRVVSLLDTEELNKVMQAILEENATHAIKLAYVSTPPASSFI